ncbi:MAG: DUF4402 domain-containing protein [candidate division Zixibacteria bacterium]|nr:DUF4402 domain-containing protein [candidate division Zixibacteria bacterium]
MRRFALIVISAIFFLSPQARGQAISISLVNNLQFGNVFPGQPKVIAKSTAGAAAEFHVAGTAGAEVLITFLTLPTYVNAGGANMNVVISQTDCAMDSSATPNQSTPGYNNLNPWQPITYRLGSNGLTIWLGATVVPNVGQKSGSYSGLIQVRAEYTGN